MFVIKREWLTKEEGIPPLIAQVIENVVNLQILPFLDRTQYKCKAHFISEDGMKSLAQNSLEANGTYGPFIGANLCLMVDMVDDTEVPGTLKTVSEQGDSTPNEE